MNCVGVVVTFNRKALLLENLHMLRKQSYPLDKVIIIDNHSTDNTKDVVYSEFRDDTSWIDYRYMDKNYGGAGGFYYGVRYAFESGADACWLMDDDGKPYNEYTFERICQAAEILKSKNPFLFLNSLVTYDGKNLSYGFWPSLSKNEQLVKITTEAKNNILFEKANPFNGTFITRELIEKIGYPRKDFFISCDETDYLKRSQRAGAQIATVVDSIYQHPSSKLQYKNILGFYTQIYTDLDKEYYFLRNRYCVYPKSEFKQFSMLVLLRIFTIMLYENMKLKRLLQIPQAISDAKNNRMGKRSQ